MFLIRRFRLWGGIILASRVEEFDALIEKYAKQEFLEKGFSDASLRTIAKNAGVSTSTIYTRYLDKEGLFRFLVEPASNAMIAYVERSLAGFEALPDQVQLEQRNDISDQGFSVLVDMIYENFDQFKLLVTCAPTNLYHEFLEKIVSLDIQCMRKFLTVTHCQAYADGEITDGFLHVVSSAFYSGIFEVVIHDMPRKEAENYINQLRKFYNSGWNDYF